MKIRTFFRGLMLALLLAAGPSVGRADFIVVPNEVAATEGNANNTLPFFNPTPIGVRYQQVYHASQFSALTGPSLITQMAFRPDSISGRPFGEVLTNVQIYLSTTAADPDALSITFANNIGANNTLVRSGSLTLVSGFTGPSGGPKDFDIVVTFTTPFLYNPAAGNLLLDVKNFGTQRGIGLDAERMGGADVSRVWSIGMGETADTDGLPSLGLVTRFTFVSVPEPSTGALLMAMVGVRVVTRLRARQ